MLDKLHGDGRARRGIPRGATPTATSSRSDPATTIARRCSRTAGSGDSETFQDVIREAEQAGVVFYLDFDASDDWLVELGGDDAEAKANLAPLSAVGMSAWQEDGIAHAVLRVTTDD